MPNPRCPVAGIPMLLVALAALSACDGDDGPTEPEVQPLNITTTTLKTGAVGQLYADGINAEGGVGGYFWDVISGTLPPGVTTAVGDLSGDDLLVDGIPETEGTYTFRLEVRTAAGEADTAQFSVQILPAPSDFRIANFAIPPITAGGPVEIPLRTRGSPAATFTWTLVAGRLPPGLTLQSDGLITGSATTPGEYTFSVGVSSGTEQTFRQLSIRVIPDQPGSFQLTVFPVVEIPEDIRPHVEAAVRRWEEVITGDLGNETLPRDFFRPGDCGGFGVDTNGVPIEDVLLIVEIDSIDGPGKVLGQAAPCAIRDNVLPGLGILTLDSSDLLPITGTETLTSIIAHEIGHILGIGTLWQNLNLLTGAGTADPRFVGEQTIAVWRAWGGEGAVPVENQGGEGTRDSHWREDVFFIELMTGFAENVGVDMPLSRLTIASLADLGFTVDLTAADPFNIGVAGSLRGQLDRQHLGWDVAGAEPLRVIGERGTPAADRRP